METVSDVVQEDGGNQGWEDRGWGQAGMCSTGVKAIKVGEDGSYGCVGWRVVADYCRMGSWLETAIDGQDRGWKELGMGMEDVESQGQERVIVDKLMGMDGVACREV